MKGCGVVSSSIGSHKWCIRAWQCNVVTERETMVGRCVRREHHNEDGQMSSYRVKGKVSGHISIPP